MNLNAGITTKKESVLIFFFVVSGLSLFAQKFQIAEDRSTIQVWFKEKVPLHSLAVYAGKEILTIPKNFPAMMGRFQYKTDTLCFTPTFPFHPGRYYHLFHEDQKLLRFQAPETGPIPQTRLTHIFPSADTVPANLLKMYLYFSAPMREGFAYEHLRVKDEQGNTLPMPFLELQPELWDSNSQRLTLWFDPGRIKRDLNPNKDLGVPLETGKTYSLSFSSSWRDLKGNEIQADLTHSFFVTQADRQKPSPKTWALIPPKAETKEALNLHFGEAMDQALAKSTISIWKGKDALKGEVQLCAEESIWSFSPHHNWDAGEYTLQIEGRLEDLAGNNLNRLFDRDIVKDPELPKAQEVFTLTFLVKHP